MVQASRQRPEAMADITASLIKARQAVAPWRSG
jgi:hypothetical protein